MQYRYAKKYLFSLTIFILYDSLYEMFAHARTVRSPFGKARFPFFPVCLRDRLEGFRFIVMTEDVMEGREGGKAIRDISRIVRPLGYYTKKSSFSYTTVGSWRNIWEM